MRRWCVVALLCFVALMLHARGGWEEPPGGWLYVYEAGPGEDAYEPLRWVEGCLDGTWVRGQSSEEWDGLKPGEGAVPHGGIAVMTLPDEGEDGGDASVLSIENVGDPRQPPYNLPDPSNRKMFLVKNMTGDLNFDEGFTMCARLRLDPDPVDVSCPACPDFGNGMDLHDTNKGILGFTQRGVATVSLTLTDSQELSLLSPTAAPRVDLGGSATRWITVWLAVRRSNAATGEYTVSLYLDGEADPVAGYAEDLYFNIPLSFENTAENPFDAYLNLGAGATPQDIAWQLDYLCVASGFHLAVPLQEGCPGGLAAAAEGDAVRLTWNIRELPVTSFAVARDGVVLEGALPGAATEYLDTGVIPGAYTYTVTPTMDGATCLPMEISVDLCPRSFLAVPRGSNVTLTWQNRMTYAGIIITRDGVEIASIAGDRESYVDADVQQRGDVTYTVAPSTGSCTPLSMTVYVIGSVPAETADFNPPDDGWGYVYDPAAGDTPETMLQYEPVSGTLGCFDGVWTRLNRSDNWDGSAPGEVDTETDVNMDGQLDGPAPGGIGLGVVAGGAPGGGDAGVLSFEDVGNPNDVAFTWEGMARRWSDAVDPGIPGSGSNRKLYVGHNFNYLSDDEFLPNALLDDGVTLNVRLRLTPEDAVVDFEGAGVTAPSGLPPQANGKGIVSLYWVPQVPDTLFDPIRKLPVFLWADAQGIFWLQLNAGAAQDIVTLYLGETPQEGTAFVNLWITVERSSFADMIHTVTLYLNGRDVPHVQKDVVLSQAETEDEAGWGNVVIVGTMATPAVCAFQLDFVKLAAGVNTPGSGIVQELFIRGDANQDGNVNIADAISVLGYLFGTAGDPSKEVVARCLDAADANNDGQVNIADAIALLSHLFAGADPLPAPFPGCGPDSGEPDMLPACDHAACP